LNLFAAKPQRVVTRYVWGFLSRLFDFYQTATSISKGDVWVKDSKLMPVLYYRFGHLVRIHDRRQYGSLI
jgi:hypothetical protein